MIRNDVSAHSSLVLWPLEFSLSVHIGIVVMATEVSLNVLIFVFKRKCSSESYLSISQDFEQVAFGSRDVSVN